MTDEKQKQIVTKEEQELDEFAEEVKDDLSALAQPKQPAPAKQKDLKVIDINWDEIPYIFSLRDKMKDALELDLEHISGSPAFMVKNGAEPHTVTENSCNCKDWEINGSSIKPCKHILRVKYSNDELSKILDGDLIKGHKVATHLPSEGKIDKARKKIEEPGKKQKPEGEVQLKTQKQEIALIESEEDNLLMIPDIAPALAEIGKIKIGKFSDKRTKSGRLLPEKLDHFELGTLMKDEEGRVEMDEGMTEAIDGDKTELDISLCYDEPALNFPTFYAAFTQSKLACMGDSRKAWQRQEDGERKEIVCDRKQCSLAKDKKCKPYGRLSVILTTANRIGGTYVFRTTSWNSIRNIISSMSFIRNQTGGILAGVPLKLKLRAATTIPNGLGHKVTIYVVNLEYAGNMEQLKDDATIEIKRRKQLGLNMYELEQVQKGAIREHTRIEAEEEAEEIAGEFYSDGEVIEE